MSDPDNPDRHTCDCCATLARLRQKNIAYVRKHRAQKKAARALMEKITGLRGGESGPPEVPPDPT